MKYLSTKTPDNYVCGQCGATGIKLWRCLAFCVSQVDLRCAKCLDHGEVDEEGYFKDSKYGKSDQCFIKELGSMLPAIPTEEENTYWGYTSVPMDGVMWWRNLPNERKDELNVAGVSNWRLLRSWFRIRK